MKILAFLFSNSKSRFAILLQLRELMYERVEHWDIYISLSAFQGDTRYSDVASEESFSEKLSLTDLMGHGKVFHCTKNHNSDSISADGLLLSATRGGQSRSRQAIHFVYAGGEVGHQAGTIVLYGRDCGTRICGSGARRGLIVRPRTRIYGSGAWEGVNRPRADLNQLMPRTFKSPLTKPKHSSLVEEWRPMRP